MTVKQEYEKTKAELRSWNKRSNFDDTKYAYHIEHHTKEAKQMFLNLLNSDGDMTYEHGVINQIKALVNAGAVIKEIFQY